MFYSTSRLHETGKHQPQRGNKMMKIKVESSKDTSEFDYVGKWENESPISDLDAACQIQQLLNLAKVSNYGIKKVSVYNLKGQESNGDDMHEGTFYATSV